MDLLELSTDLMSLIDRSRRGVTKAEIKDLQRKTQLTNEQLARIVHLTPRALQKYKLTDALKPNVSERAIALAQLYARGFDMMGKSDSYDG